MRTANTNELPFSRLEASVLCVLHPVDFRKTTFSGSVPLLMLGELALCPILPAEVPESVEVDVNL
jgi:hypothetical protein